MSKSTFLAGIWLGVMLLSTMGCGGNGSNPCAIIGLNVLPATATVDHTAAAPGNSQTFSTSFQFNNQSGCTVIAADLQLFNWTVSDPSVHLSSSPTAAITATCTAAVTTPVTITATSADGKLTGRASLTCN